MLIPKKNRVAIYEYLFKEGVLVAKKDPFAAKHAEIEVPNLHVMKALTVSILSVSLLLFACATLALCVKDSYDVGGLHINPVQF